MVCNVQMQCAVCTGGVQLIVVRGFLCSGHSSKDNLGTKTSRNSPSDSNEKKMGDRGVICDILTIFFRATFCQYFSVRYFSGILAVCSSI